MPREFFDPSPENQNVVLVNDSTLRIDNLALLGKVWGFLKYHHPAVVSGQRHWDYDLLRILPQVLSANDRNTAQTAIRNWIQTLGDIPAARIEQLARPAL